MQSIPYGYIVNITLSSFSCVMKQRVRAQTMDPVMTELPRENLNAATTLAKIGNSCFGLFTVKFGRRNET